MLSFSPFLLLLLLLCDRGRENVFVRIPFFAIESRLDNFPNLDFVLTTKTQDRLLKKKLNQILSDVVTFNLGESLSTSTKAHVTHSHRRPPPSSSFATVHIRTQHPSIYMYCQCMGKRLISAPVCSPSSVILSLAQKGIEERECRTMFFLSSHYARCHLTRCCKKEGPSVPHVLL